MSSATYFATCPGPSGATPLVIATVGAFEGVGQFLERPFELACVRLEVRAEEFDDQLRHGGLARFGARRGEDL